MAKISFLCPLSAYLLARYHQVSGGPVIQRELTKCPLFVNRVICKPFGLDLEIALLTLTLLWALIHSKKHFPPKCLESYKKPLFTLKTLSGKLKGAKKQCSDPTGTYLVSEPHAHLGRGGGFRDSALIPAHFCCHQLLYCLNLRGLSTPQWWPGQPINHETIQVKQPHKQSDNLSGTQRNSGFLDPISLQVKFALTTSHCGLCPA